jgi:NAD(P)H-hydrate epimerase
MLQPLEQIQACVLATAADVRAIEREAIDARGVPGIVLMKRAGRAVFERIRARGAAVLSVFCGSGNNAGDGYVIAALARAAGLDACIVQVGDVAKLPADAARARAWAREAQVPELAWRGDDAALAARCAASDVLVDALLGTGVGGAPRAEYAAAIARLNERPVPVLAVDLPSGLVADTGAAPGAVVHAAETITFIAVKPGLLTGRGPEFTGALWLDELDLPADVLAARGAEAPVIERVRWQPRLAPAPRRRDAHKGDSGHVLVLGGAPGMGGAAMLAAEAAMRSGAGLVSVGVSPEYAAAMLARRPELMARGLAGCVEDRDDDDLAALIARATVIAVGPGLGQAAYGRRVLAAALAAGRPLVLDADALNLLAAGEVGATAASGPWPADAVLTPHPAEAARILGVGTPEVQRDRPAAARALVARTGAVVVLKGAGSIVADATRLRICTDGNPGMAVGGMGDVLAGVVAALRAQGLPAFEAAVAGTCMHARAGDAAAAEGGERGLLAGDLLPHLRALVNGRGER